MARLLLGSRSVSPHANATSIPPPQEVVVSPPVTPAGGTCTYQDAATSFFVTMYRQFGARATVAVMALWCCRLDVGVKPGPPAMDFDDRHRKSARQSTSSLFAGPIRLSPHGLDDRSPSASGRSAGITAIDSARLHTVDMEATVTVLIHDHGCSRLWHRRCRSASRCFGGESPIVTCLRQAAEDISCPAHRTDCARDPHHSEFTMRSSRRRQSVGRVAFIQPCADRRVVLTQPRRRVVLLPPAGIRPVTEPHRRPGQLDRAEHRIRRPR